MKTTQAQIIAQVFGPETRTNYNPAVNNAAIIIGSMFRAPSGATPGHYKAADKAAFAKAVQAEMNQE